MPISSTIHPYRWLTIALCAAAIAAPAAMRARAFAAPDDVIPAQARRTIAKANADWLVAMREQDAKVVADVYASDGVFVTRTGDTVVGPAAVERMMRDRFAQTGPAADVSLAQDGIVQQGPLIYEWGHAEITYKQPGGTAVKAGGRYLTVWKQGADGVWRIHRNLSLE